VLGGADLIAKATGFVVAMVIVRHFGSVGFGALSFAGSIVMHALMIGTCGLDLYAVRNTARAPEKLGAMVSTIIFLRFALGLGVYGALVALALTLPSLYSNYGLITLFGLTIFTSAVSLSWVPQALEKTNVLALANFSTQVLNLVFILLAMQMTSDILSVPVAQLVAEALVALGLFLWTLKLVGRVERPLPRKYCQNILSQSAPIGASQILRTVSLGSDLVVLGFLVSMEELGWYAGAYKLFLLGVSMGGLYFVILFPRLVQKSEITLSALSHEVGVSIRRVLRFVLPAIALVGIFSADLLQLLYDASFRVASAALIILLLAMLVNLLSSHYRSALIARGKQQTDFINVSLASAVHVVSKLTLVPLFGMNGAALGTLAGEGFLLLLGWLTMRRYGQKLNRRHPGETAVDTLHL
jgi:O-antigen/teichoic acid export membrane protein